MEWFKIDLSMLENEAFGCADCQQLGVWLRLMRYCCGQENRGKISGAKGWNDRKWMHLCRLERSEVADDSELWKWRGDDLVVNFFPTSDLAKVQRLRLQARDGADKRWGHQRVKAPSETPKVGMPSGMPDGINSESQEASHKGQHKASHKAMQRRGEERRGEKIRGERGPKSHMGSPDGDLHPPSKAEVLAYFTSIDAPQGLGERFFAHYEAAGWVRGGGGRIASWQALADRWVLDEKNLAKNSSGGTGAPAGFDPKQPNAHTEGVAIHN